MVLEALYGIMQCFIKKVLRRGFIWLIKLNVISVICLYFSQKLDFDVGTFYQYKNNQDFSSTFFTCL